MRQVFLDTETTGLESKLGHRIIEIAAVEILNRRLTGRRLHHYLNPEREIEGGNYIQTTAAISSDSSGGLEP